jgi:orotidine 5'-phosphate decarboxylase subfamily 2
MGEFAETLEEMTEEKKRHVALTLNPPFSMVVDLSLAGSLAEAVEAFNLAVIRKTAKQVAAYVINPAQYLTLGTDGILVMRDTASCAWRRGGVPVIIDARWGHNTVQNTHFACTVFERWKGAAVTAAPYHGVQTLVPLLGHSTKGVFVVCTTSDPEKQSYQGRLVSSNEHLTIQQPLYRAVASDVARLSGHYSNIGVSASACHPQMLGGVREAAGEDIFILVQDVDREGVELEAVLRAATNSAGRRALLSTSVGFLQCAKGSSQETFAETVFRALKDLNHQVNSLLCVKRLEASSLPGEGGAR